VNRRSTPCVLALAGVLAAFAAPALADARKDAADIALVNRITFGAEARDVEAIRREGAQRWLESELRPGEDDALPPEIAQRIAAFRISQRPLESLLDDLEAQNKAANALADPDAKKAAQGAYQQALNDLLKETAARQIYRDLYSANQLKEEMTWFWFNHFNVHAYKANIRVMVGDYEERAIRPHALGRFRDLLEATLRHPAMLRYLDNVDNAAGKINENYAREIMELHTMGVGSGYTQTDVQELARILTGVGLDPRPGPLKVRPELEPYVVREGAFAFNPARHDFGDKVFLGRRIKGSGFAEVEEALDLLARQPATARHVSRQLAEFFVSDAPSDALVDAMARAFQRSDGDIAQVLRTLFQTAEFRASLGTKLKDPVRYVISAVRAAYPDRPILNPGPVQGWINRLGEGLYNHDTPDGFSMGSAAWSGPGQLAARFEVARQIGSGSSGLFRPDLPGAGDQPAYPLLQNALWFQGLADTVSPNTRRALGAAISPQDWNTLYLSSPDFMRR
jgi:uncharacterized protein (DUF1800 family)